MTCITCCPETKCKMPSLNVLMGAVFVGSVTVFSWTLLENGVENISMQATLDDGKGMAGAFGLGLSTAYGIYLACKQASGCYANLIARANGEVCNDDNSSSRYLGLVG